MAFKFITIFALLAAVNAGVIQVSQHPQQHVTYEHEPSVYQHQAAPQQHHLLLQKSHHAHEEYPNDPHPKYNFNYEVHDSLSGDSKSQTETRDGDVVHGEYSLDDADGFRRTVKYTADDVNGFNAVVHREPIPGRKEITHAAPVHVQAAPVHAVQYHHAPTAVVKTAYVAPTAVVKTPVTYAAPINHHAHPEQAHYQSYNEQAQQSYNEAGHQSYTEQSHSSYPEQSNQSQYTSYEAPQQESQESLYQH